jgi:Spx/MgsR family transcriptional regulator
MQKVTMYGIKACDTVKKARVWLDTKGIDYEFIDFKKTPPDEALLNKWIHAAGLETVVNKRGTTWRKLTTDQQQNIFSAGLLAPLMENPSTIKRPVLETENGIYFGFKPDLYEKALTTATE